MAQDEEMRDFSPEHQGSVMEEEQLQENIGLTRFIGLVAVVEQMTKQEPEKAPC